MKKCDEQVKIRDEQARGVKMEGKMRAEFLDRRTESERSGERLLQAARRVSAANQFSGFTGVGGKAFGLNSSLP
jgi:hypothetical protein